LIVPWTALTAWLSLGTMGFASAAGARLALLPADAATCAIVLSAVIGTAVLAKKGAPLWPLSLLILILFPWLPLRVPAAFLIWSGPTAAIIWMAVVLTMLVAAATSADLSSAARWLDLLRARWQWRGHNLRPAFAGLLALVIFGASAWRTAPSFPSGDEPHYLVITQSLLLDRDLKIQNNHRRGDYRSFHAADLPPHFQRLGRDGEIYSIHAPGLSAIVLPAFAIAGYRGAVVFLLTVAAAGSALSWWVAWLATRRDDAAWFGWAAVTLPVSAVFHSFTIYPDGLGGTLTLTAVWALLRADDERRSGSVRVRSWFWHGVLLAMLPWLHSRFAVIAGCLGALILLRLAATRNPAAKAVAFLSVPAVSAMAWLGYFVAIYGTPDPSSPYGPGEIGSLRWVAGGLGGLLFDQRFGLIPYAPVLACAFAGLIVMLARQMSRRLAIELSFAMLPYLVTVTHFAMWWGGWSPPARFFVPVLPLLAIPAAVLWTVVQDYRRRALIATALAFTGLVTATLVIVDRGRLALNVRDTPALWFTWLSAAADLPQALPWWTRDAVMPFFRDVAIWLALLSAAVFVMRSSWRSRTMQQVTLLWPLPLAIMVASTTVWATRGVDGRNIAASQMDLLRADASTRQHLGVDLDRMRTITRGSLPQRIRIELVRPMTLDREAGRNVPLFEVPRVPAGEYRITPVAGTPRGWLMIGIGRDQFAIRTEQISHPAQSISVRFPVPVRGIVIRGDDDARQTVGGLLVEPVALLRSARFDAATARTAVRYGRTTVFFLDDRSSPEPEAFWSGGARTSSFAIQPDEPRSSVSLLLRNGPHVNQVAMDIGGAVSTLEFGPGEERRVNARVNRSQGAALITLNVKGGFRPSEQNPSSRDNRFLGIWVKVE
jgi:hypothetical protein